MRKSGSFRVVSYAQDGRLTPRASQGLRAGAVTLNRHEVMAWHSTSRREELLIGLRGRVHVDVRRSARPLRRLILRQGRCLLLPPQTLHRVVNRSRSVARYLYVTAISFQLSAKTRTRSVAICRSC